MSSPKVNAKLNRREFVTAGAMLGAAASAASSLAIADEAPSDDAFERSVEWDSEYDVIVVGLGGAGCATAITAADAGAKVLVLEKAPEGYSGGNSNICMQWICYTEDPEGVRTYFEQLRGGYETPSDAILDVYIDEMQKNKEWFEGLGAPNVQTFDYVEYPQFEGSSAFTPLTVDGSTGMIPPVVFGGNGACYNLLKKNVVDRADNIDVWYEAPATHLIQDPQTKVIHGVTAQVGDKEVKVRAKNGVVLTCGGYENSPQMQQDYNQHLFWPPTGTCYYNEGDGIKMALEVNADLWHMANIVTNNGCFRNEETGNATFGFGIYVATRGINIANNGTRVYDGKAYHGKMPYNDVYLNAALPETYWYVYDQTIQDAGAITPTWSADSSEEIEKGWVIKADTLDELAQKMGLSEDAAQTMQQTIDVYNGFAADGFDPVFGRSAESMFAIQTGPFYACKQTCCCGNTQGGPRRNERGEVLDVAGEPIPHLYEAGELGDIWSNLYQASCNLGGGMIFGRISGANAAAVKNDVTQDDLVAAPFKPEVVEDEYECGDNQYIGRGMGKGEAPMVVRVTVDGDKVSQVEILKHYETEGLAAIDRALTELPEAIAQAGSVDVDMVAGATRTSAGIIAAVSDALSQA